VKGLIAGLSQTAAARAAGYKGDGAGLRGLASRLAKSNKVRALLGWAKAGGAGPSDAPGDVSELKRILWKHARGADKNHALKATEILHRLAAQEREAGQAMADDGFGDWRMARDLLMVRGADGAAAYMLFSSHTALSCLPMLQDLARAVRPAHPQLWADLVKRQSDVMRTDLENKLADTSWQLAPREKIWGEAGWIIGSDGVAKPDPQGRGFISP